MADDDETNGTPAGKGSDHLPLQEGLPPGVNVVARVGTVTRAALADADALALILDEHQAASAEESTPSSEAPPSSSDAPPADEAPHPGEEDSRRTPASSTDERVMEGEAREVGDDAGREAGKRVDAAQLARECVERAGEFSVFIAVEADQRPPELRFDRAARSPTRDRPDEPETPPPLDAAAEASGEGPGAGDDEPGANPLESFEAFGSWFNKMVETAADQFTGNDDDDGSDDDDDDDGEDLARGDAAAGMPSSGTKSPEEKKPAARKKIDSENERAERERKEREAEALRRYTPKRPREAANALAARCGVRAGRILSVATMHLVPPPGGFARNGGAAGGDDDSDPEPDGDGSKPLEPREGGEAETEQEKAERERNAAERARAMSELYRKMMDEQDRGEGPSDDGDKTDGGGDRTGGEGGDLTNYVDDAEIEAMLGETEAANNWSKVTDREYAWVKAVGKTCQAIMVEKTLGLIERYAPLRAYVRYWAAVVRADETLSNHADATEQAKAVAANTLGRILTSAAEGMPNVGFVGAAELAALHRRRDPSISAGWLKALIYGDSTMSFTGGTILSLGGPAAAPVTAPPALAMYFTIRLRLCLAIAALGGCDVLGPEAGAAALACFFGTDARELLDARPCVEELDALIAAADDATANCADATDGPGQSSSWLPDVSGAMSRVFEAGASAQRVAQRCAAGYAARASAHVARRAAMGRETFQSGTGDVDADRARVYEAAYRRALPREMVRAMGEHVFTAANMVVVAAELVPFVSSYLTVRAANAAIKCHLPHLAPAAEAELENAKDSADANAAAATPSGGWTKDITDGASKVANSVGAAASEAAARTSAAAAAAGAGIASLWSKASETAASSIKVTGLVREGGTEPVPRLSDPDAPRTFVSTGSGGVV